MTGQWNKLSLLLINNNSGKFYTLLGTLIMLSRTTDDVIPAFLVEQGTVELRPGN